MFVSGYFLNLTRGYKEFFVRKTLRRSCRFTFGTRLTAPCAGI